jgi:hypothetical protein
MYALLTEDSVAARHKGKAALTLLANDAEQLFRLASLLDLRSLLELAQPYARLCYLARNRRDVAQRHSGEQSLTELHLVACN